MALLITMSELISLLRTLTETPLLLWGVLMASTLISEDAAIVGGALLVTQGVMSFTAAFSAVNMGVIVGDTGLYAIGWAASRYRPLRAMVATREIYRAKRFIRGQLVPILLSTRILPGSRLPTYTACGFFRFPLALFVVVLTLASLIWTAIVFAVIQTVGPVIMEQLGPWKWVGVIALIGLFFLFPRLFGKRLAKRFGLIGRGGSTDV